jgi:hypothetical protein
MFYTDARKRALTGLGHLLKSDDNVVLLPQDQSGSSPTGDSLTLGGSQDLQAANCQSAHRKHDVAFLDRGGLATVLFFSTPTLVAFKTAQRTPWLARAKRIP